MKTNLFIAALSLVVLAGCSSEDEIDTLVSKSDNAITFGTYVGKQTKAIEKSAFAENDHLGYLHSIRKLRGITILKILLISCMNNPLKKAQEKQNGHTAL